MKDYQGFKNNGNWYKGNLHSHTTVSDGKMTPEQSVEVYKEHGYNFLALSEHDIYTDYRKQYNTDNFIMIPAIEASAILYQEEGSSKRLEIHHLHGIARYQRDAEKRQGSAVHPHGARSPAEALRNLARPGDLSGDRGYAA